MGFCHALARLSLPEKVETARWVRIGSGRWRARVGFQVSSLDVLVRLVLVLCSDVEFRGERGVFSAKALVELVGCPQDCDGNGNRARHMMPSRRIRSASGLFLVSADGE